MLELYSEPSFLFDLDLLGTTVDAIDILLTPDEAEFAPDFAFVELKVILRPDGIVSKVLVFDGVFFFGDAFFFGVAFGVAFEKVILVPELMSLIDFNADPGENLGILEFVFVDDPLFFFTGLDVLFLDFVFTGLGVFSLLNPVFFN
jgi:hypothetical protein